MAVILCAGPGAVAAQLGLHARRDIFEEGAKELCFFGVLFCCTTHQRIVVHTRVFSRQLD